VTVLFAIILLLIIPAGMLVIRVLRSKSSFLWLLAMVGTLVAWPAVYLSRLNMPQVIAPFTWQPDSLLLISPSLLVDATSWAFAIALATQVLSIMLTSVARFSTVHAKSQEYSLETVNPEAILSTQPVSSQITNWHAWAANLAMTSLGLVAVLAGNLLTLLLAWAALDIVELLLLLGQVSTTQERERVVISFATRIGGIGALLLAMVIIWQQDGLLDFPLNTPQASLLLLLAAGLRLGILPLHMPFFRELPMRRGLGTILRLVPIAASLLLLVRTSETVIRSDATPYLLGFTAIAGIYGAISWLRAQDELAGRPYWILGTTSLAMSAAILSQPVACLAWSLATLLPGSLLFITSVRRKSLAPILGLGLLGLVGLPYTPAWTGTSIFQAITVSPNILRALASLLTALSFFIIHALLIAGYLAHSLRGTIIPTDSPQPKVERWVWLLYPAGLAILPLSHFLVGWIIRPSIAHVSLLMWVEGASAIGLASAFWLYSSRIPSHNEESSSHSRLSEFSRFQSVTAGQFYRLFWGGYRLLAQVIGLISSVLEGEAGILWALVLMVLVAVFLQH
jgi:hypothetical protein